VEKGEKRRGNSICRNTYNGYNIKYKIFDTSKPYKLKSGKNNALR